MATAQIATNVSLDEFLDGINDKERYARCEYWDGEVILKDADFDDDMSPVKTHSFVQVQLSIQLGIYLKANPVGTVFTELHCILPGTRRVLVPDLAVVLGSVEIDDGPLRGAPDLVIEILSPSDRASMASRKVTTYLD